MCFLYGCKGGLIPPKGKANITISFIDTKLLEGFMCNVTPSMYEYKLYTIIPFYLNYRPSIYVFKLYGNSQAKT